MLPVVLDADVAGLLEAVPSLKSAELTAAYAAGLHRTCLGYYDHDGTATNR
jgi:hypothetical protein